jgi:RimJ/RimL family protein N-acetyltransferase
MYSFKAKHQVMVLPWCKTFLLLCSVLILLQVGISGYLLWGGNSAAAMTAATVLLILTGSGVWFMLRHGKARLCGAQLTVWNLGLPKKVTSQSLGAADLRSRFVDLRYIESFNAQLSYVASLDQASAARQLSPEVIPFAGGSLAPWLPSRLDAFNALFSDAELMAWHDVDQHSLGEAHRRVAYSSTHDQFRSFWTYMLLDENGGLCGHVEMRLIGLKGKLGEISFGLLAVHRGQGYMTKALLALVQYWTHEHGVEQIVARTKHANLSCKRLLSRLGFTQNDLVFTEEKLGVCESSELTYIWRQTV